MDGKDVRALSFGRRDRRRIIQPVEIVECRNWPSFAGITAPQVQPFCESSLLRNFTYTLPRTESTTLPARGVTLQMAAIVPFPSQWHSPGFGCMIVRMADIAS